MPRADDELRTAGEVPRAVTEELRRAGDADAALAVEAETDEAAEIAAEAEAPFGIDLAVVTEAHACDRVRIEVPTGAHEGEEDARLDLAFDLVIRSDAETFDLELSERAERPRIAAEDAHDERGRGREVPEHVARSVADKREP